MKFGAHLCTCSVATGLARELGVSIQDEYDTYYVALLRFLGCTSEASGDAALIGGDEIALYAGLAPSFMGAPSETIGWMLCRRIGLGDSVLRALGCTFERWDGKGLPNGIAGEAIPVSCRVAMIARDYDLLNRMWGPNAATEILKRKGKAYEPRVLETARAHAPQLRAQLEDGSLWELVLEAEPGPPRRPPSSREGISSIPRIQPSWTLSIGSSPVTADYSARWCTASILRSGINHMRATTTYSASATQRAG